MSYKVLATDFFAKKLKDLSHKYWKIRDDYKELLDELEKTPYSGDRIQGCKGLVLKTRMASRDMQKGKSGGFRIIYLVLEKEREVHLLTLYPKSERENISASEINQILEKTGFLQ